MQAGQPVDYDPFFLSFECLGFKFLSFYMLNYLSVSLWANPDFTSGDGIANAGGKVNGITDDGIFSSPGGANITG